MRYLINIFYILLATSIFIWKSEAQGFNGTCETLDSISKPAYTYWPFSLDCNHLRSIWEERSESTNTDVLQCLITQGERVINGGTDELTSMGNDTTYTAKLIINNATCLSEEIRIDLQPFPEVSCKQSVNESKVRGDVIFQEATIGDSVELKCRAPEGSPQTIPPGSDVTKFKTRWFVACENKKYRTNNLWTETSDPGYPDALNMPRVDFYDAAEFTCTVEYEGRRLYVVTYAQCIKQKTKQVIPTLTCTKDETEAPGDDATLDCTGQIVFGTTSSDDLIIEWRKDGKIICENRYFNQTQQGFVNVRQSCIAQGNNDSVVCVADGENTSGEDIQLERKAIDMKLHIRILEKSDFDNYEIALRYREKGTDVWKSDTWEITLHEDLTPFYERLVIILSVCLGVLILIICLVFLVKKYQIYILIAYKRSWLWKYDKDDKHYVCYLSYLYDRETLSDESLNATTTIVCAIQKLMESLEYKYYDEQRQCDFTVQVEKITNLVENCHRMVLILTPEYLQDRWMRFHAELGFHGLLESQMGLIFVLTPGVKRTLKKLARHDKVWNRLLIAIKTNRVIKWKKDMSDEVLKNHIEYLLPKLAGRNRAVSCSDSVSEGESNPAYLRSLSQTTTHTTVSADSTTPEDQRLYSII